MMKATYKTNIKIGDKIYHITGDVAEVISINKDADLPVRLKFESGSIGHFALEPNKFGIWEWLMVKPKTEKANAVYFTKRETIEIDTLVNVYNYSTSKWEKKYFAGYELDGTPTVWKGGASSMTTNSDPVKIRGAWATDENLDKVKAKQRVNKGL